MFISSIAYTPNTNMTQQPEPSVKSGHEFNKLCGAGIPSGTRITPPCDCKEECVCDLLAVCTQSNRSYLSVLVQSQQHSSPVMTLVFDPDFSAGPPSCDTPETPNPRPVFDSPRYLNAPLAHLGNETGSLASDSIKSTPTKMKTQPLESFVELADKNDTQPEPTPARMFSEASLESGNAMFSQENTGSQSIEVEEEIDSPMTPCGRHFDRCEHPNASVCWMKREGRYRTVPFHDIPVVYKWDHRKWCKCTLCVKRWNMILEKSRTTEQKERKQREMIETAAEKNFAKKFPDLQGLFSIDHAHIHKIDPNSADFVSDALGKLSEEITSSTAVLSAFLESVAGGVAGARSIFSPENLLAIASQLTIIYKNISDKVTVTCAVITLGSLLGIGRALLPAFQSLLGRIQGLSFFKKAQVQADVTDPLDVWNSYHGDKIFAAIGSFLTIVIGALLMKKLPGKGTADEFMNRFKSIGQCINSAKTLSSFGFDFANEIVSNVKVYLFGERARAFDSEKTVKEWMNEVESMMTLAASVDIKTSTAAQANADALYSRGLQIAKEFEAMRVPAPALTAFREYLKASAELRRQAHASGAGHSIPRFNPTIIQIFGPTGLGKSVLVDALCADLCRSDGLLTPEDIDDAKYYRKVGQEFWDGFTSNKRVVVYDDFGQMQDSIAKPNPEFLELIHIGNNAPYPVHMASIAEKATTFFSAGACVLTTNQETFNVKSLTHPDAVKRRLDIRVQVSIAPEFAMPGVESASTTRLDYTKVDLTDPTGVSMLAPYRFRVVKESVYDSPLRDEHFVQGPDDLLTFSEFSDLCIGAYQEKKSHSSRLLACLKNYASRPVIQSDIPDVDFDFDVGDVTPSDLGVSSLEKLDAIETLLGSLPRNFYTGQVIKRIRNDFEALDILYATALYHQDLLSQFVSEISYTTTEHFEVDIRSPGCNGKEDVAGTIPGFRTVVKRVPNPRIELTWWETMFGRDEFIRLTQTDVFHCAKMFVPAEIPKVEGYERVELLLNSGEMVFKVASLLRNRSILSAFSTAMIHPVEERLDVFSYVLNRLGTDISKVALPPRNYFVCRDVISNSAALRFVAPKLTAASNVICSFYDSVCSVLGKLFGYTTSVLGIRGFISEFLAGMYATLRQAALYLAIVFSASMIVKIIMKVVGWLFPSTVSKTKKKKTRVESYEEGDKSKATIYVEADGSLEAYSTEDTKPPRVAVETYDSPESTPPRPKIEGYSDDWTGPPRPKVEGDDITAELHAVLDQNGINVVSSLMHKSISRLEYHTAEGWKMLGSVLFVCGRIAVCNKHFDMILTRGPTTQFRLSDMNCKDGFLFQSKDIRWVSNPHDHPVYGKRDIMLIEFPKDIRPRPDIRSSLINKNDFTHYSTVNKLALVGFLPSDKLVGVVQTTCNAKARDCDVEAVGGGHKLTIRCSFGYDIETMKGQCGSAVVDLQGNHQRKIIGIHALGGDEFPGSCTPLTAENFNYLYESFATTEILPAQLHCEIPKYTHIRTAPSTWQICVPSLGNNFADYGTVEQCVNAPGKTNIHPSPLYNLVTKPTMAPAKLRPYINEGQIIDPEAMARKKADVAPSCVDSNLLKSAAKDVKSVFVKEDEYSRVFSLQEAIEGTPGDQWVQPLNRKASPGVPWRYDMILPSGIKSSGKHKWLSEGGLAGGDYRFDHPELISAVETRLSAARVGQRTSTIWYDTLKDERRPIERVKAGKTRLFAVGPLDFNVAFRMYFLGFIAMIMKNNVRTESCVGINPYSLDWNRVHAKLSSKGKNVIAGDFSNFDGTLSAKILWEICDMINEWYDDSAENALIRRVLWSEIVHSVHQSGKTLYGWNHSQPSGNPATVIINSIYNSLATRIAYLTVARVSSPLNASMTQFNKHVSMVSYGDDNVINISDEASPWFNMDSITEGFLSFGMVYTDELKSVDSLGMRTLEEVSFLKRGFRFDPTQHRWRAPLSVKTCTEMCMWVRGLEDVHELTATTVEMACYELAQHDEETFDKYVTLIERAVKMAELTTRPSIETFDVYQTLDVSRYLGIDGSSAFPEEQANAAGLCTLPNRINA